MSDDPPAVAAADHLDPLSSLPIPSSIFSDDISFSDDFLSFNSDNIDLTLDDLHLPSDSDQFLNSDFDPHHDYLNDVVFDPSSGNNNDNNLSDVSQFLNFPLSPVDHVNDEIIKNIDYNNNNININNNNNDSNYININDNDSNSNKNDDSDVLYPQFPVSSSQGSGSGNCGSGRTEGGGDVNCDSCGSPESGNSVVEQKVVKKEMLLRSNYVLKRKNDEDDDENLECRTNKYRKSNEMSVTNGTENLDEKKKARLIRNRESAQLSRQRKKHYVEELEDKVRAMHSTIQDLNARISYFAAENATLKQQMVVGGGGGVGSVGVGGVGMPNMMYPVHPGMGPMGYPWMPCPPYVVKSQGSQVPLVPIPRLKPQQQRGVVMSSLEKTKKVEVKRSESGGKSKVKTKKVASVSFLGLLLFVLMFGGLVPMMNVKFGEKSGVSSDGYKFYDRGYPGRVLMGDEHVNGSNHRTGRGREDNGSEPLVASLYVPRNDRLEKIDGNLIIHSVLASEKAMANKEKPGMTKKEDSGLAGALDLVPAISVPAVGRNGGRQPHMYRTSSDRQRALSSDKENLKSKPADGKLQQWFREGLAGPMLSSGMCTEVFQFDVSTAIVPATSVVNITAENHHNSTYISTVKNRRILHGLPIPLPSSTTNITKEQVSGNDSKHEDLHKNSNVSSMVVSVLFDPREAGDGGDVEGMMGGKSFSRIFVVVLLDSVKYVTYSCMLPLKGGSHLVTA